MYFFFFSFFPSSFSSRRVVESVTLVLVLACPGARGSPTQSPPPPPPPRPPPLPAPCLTLSLSCCVVMCHVVRRPHQLATTEYTTQQRCLPTFLCTCFSCGLGGRTSWLRRSTPPSNDVCLHSCVHASPLVPAATPADYDEVHHPAVTLACFSVYMLLLWSRRPHQLTTTKRAITQQCNDVCLFSCVHAFPVVPEATPADYDEVHHPAMTLAYLRLYVPVGPSQSCLCAARLLL